MRGRYTVGNRKVAIVGAGFVGSSVAYGLTLRDIAREIVLIDIDHERTVGEAMDIRHGLPSMGTADLYEGGYEDCADCDLIVITAGMGRKPGQTRMDLAHENVKIMKSVTDNIKKYYTRGMILLISNPVDVMTQLVSEWMDLPSGLVFGSGCLLDSSRFVRSIADYLDLSTGVINGYVVGEHGDSMVPIWSHVTVGGIPITEYCKDLGIEWNDEIRARIANEVRTMGGAIIKAKKKTHYGIATCVCYMADAILNQRPILASVSSPLMGEHGVRGVSLSVPSIVGPAGVQQRIREKWSPEEYRAFFDSVEKVRSVLEEVRI